MTRKSWTRKGKTHVPNDLVHDLRYVDGMALGAGTCWTDIVGFGPHGIGNVTLMVRAVQILAVPTGRKGDDRTYAADTGLRRKCLGVRASTIDIAIVSFRRHTAMAHLAIRARSFRCGVSNKHTEARPEGGDIPVVGSGRDVVYRNSAITLQTLVGELRYALECSVTGSEVHNGGPVVRKVL